MGVCQAPYSKRMLGPRSDGGPQPFLLVRCSRERTDTASTHVLRFWC
jgi:hypothetical protein